MRGKRGHRSTLMHSDVGPPYHNHSTTVLSKISVNYDVGKQQIVSLDSFSLTADLEDDEQRLKLSHHPDGFCQFSGEGVLSGKDESGKPKGVGIFAASLADVGSGPAFSVCVHDICAFELI